MALSPPHARGSRIAEPRKVLVTGGSGGIGAATARAAPAAHVFRLLRS